MEAASSSPAPVPALPEPVEDVVEAYSFNTGNAFFENIWSAFVAHEGHCCFCIFCFSVTKTLCVLILPLAPPSAAAVHLAGLLVLLVVLWCSFGHHIAARCYSSVQLQTGPSTLARGTSGLICWDDLIVSPPIGIQG